MEPSIIKKVVRDAVTLMILEQWELCEYGVGERTVTSHLFRYMSEDRAVPSHLRVDHEYNRHEGATKTIRSQIDAEKLDHEGERRIYPDVIIHRRGDDLENWLVLEAKRGDSCDAIDRMKVEALITQYDYQWGALLSFGMNADGWEPRWEWIGPTGSDEMEELFSADDLERLNQLGRSAWDGRRGT